MSTETKHWIIEILLLVLAVIALASAPAHGALLVSESRVGGIGYGKFTWGVMTAAINTATGAPATVVVDLENAAQVAAADALWIDVRLTEDTLTATEAANVAGFIATGKRVVIMGDHESFTTWNNSFLGTLGGSFQLLPGDPVLTTAATHPLTAGVDTIKVFAGGASTAPAGAAPLFSANVATLWGASQNVLTVLDCNIWADGGQRGSEDNARFGDNVAAWIATPVPEPAGLAVFAVVATVMRRRSRRR